MASSPSTARPVILQIEHGLGGGVARHVDDLSRIFRDAADFVRLEPNRGGMLRLRDSRPGFPSTLYFRMPHEVEALHAALRAAGADRIHFHHTVRLPAEVMGLPEVLDLPYDYTVHDYFSFCPQITLTAASFKYCGEPDTRGCEQCLEVRPSPGGESIQNWRARYREFVEGAARVFVPADSVKKKMHRHFPIANLVLAPHPEPASLASAQSPAWTYRNGILRVVVLGALNAIKGADLLEECARDAASRNLPVEFHLLGYAYRHLSSPANRLTVHGKYRDADLPLLLKNLAPHLAWFPAQWPETYSYTLSAVMCEHLPVASTNLGAIPERLAGRDRSWALRWESGAVAWNDFFVRLRSDPSLCSGQLIAATAQAAKVFSYADDYLAVDAGPARLPNIGGQFDSYRSPYRAAPSVLAQYAKGYAREMMTRAYRLPGVRRIAVAAFPEHRMQALRRWLDRF